MTPVYVTLEETKEYLGVYFAEKDEEIALLYDLHGFKRVLLMNHMTCGMYRDLASRRKEEEVHREHLAAAKAILQERFPELSVETYLSVIVGDTVEVVTVSGPSRGFRS